MEPAGTFDSQKPWNYTPPKIDGTNYHGLTEKEIEELTEEEIFAIGRALWKRLPTKNVFILTEKIIKKMSKDKATVED